MVTIMGHLDGLNEYTKANRANIFAGANLKKKNETIIMTYIEKAISETEASIIDSNAYPLTINIVWYDDTRRDFDNIVFAKKFIFDALVKYGVLKDDSRKYITSVNEKVVTCKENPRIEITWEHDASAEKSMFTNKSIRERI